MYTLGLSATKFIDKSNNSGKTSSNTIQKYFNIDNQKRFQMFDEDEATKKSISPITVDDDDDESSFSSKSEEAIEGGGEETKKKQDIKNLLRKQAEKAAAAATVAISEQPKVVATRLEKEAVVVKTVKGGDLKSMLLKQAEKSKVCKENPVNKENVISSKKQQQQKANVKSLLLKQGENKMKKKVHIFPRTSPQKSPVLVVLSDSDDEDYAQIKAQLSAKKSTAKRSIEPTTTPLRAQKTKKSRTETA